MARISKDEVKRLAQLAQLELAESELDAYVAEIGDILGFIDQLQELDLKDEKPTEQVTGLTNATRKDELQDLPSETVLLSANQDLAGKQIRVPRVLP